MNLGSGSNSIIGGGGGISTVYMYPSYGLKRPPPPTHQSLLMKISAGQAFRILAVQSPL